MNKQAFINFLFLMLYKHRSKHIAIFIIATLLIFLLTSVAFIASSLQKSTLDSLNGEGDFIIQRTLMGKATTTPLTWREDIEAIRGVSIVTPRVYGRYYLPNTEIYFNIVGVDFFEEQNTQYLQSIITGLEIKTFLEKEYMLVGKGVKQYLENNHYKDYYNFLTPLGEKQKIEIFNLFSNTPNLLTNDLIIMPIDLARTILGIKEEMSTDLSINVPNEAEHDNVTFKLKTLHFDAKVIAKTDMQRAYKKFYDYKSGIFLLLFILSLVTFMLILFQRYVMVGSSDKKEIAILRMSGWSIKDVIQLKLFETLFIAVFSFLLGVLLAYLFVFILQAPLLRDIFLGFGNLAHDPRLLVVVDTGLLASLFLFFITPFIFAVLFPVWKIAITDPHESMK